MKTPLLYIEHILESIDYIAEFALNLSAKDLAENRMRYDAILRNLQTMSEAVGRLPEDIKKEYPNVPWRDIYGFRNILVHDYLGDIDAQIVWTVIHKELPELKKTMLLIKQKQTS